MKISNNHDSGVNCGAREARVKVQTITARLPGDGHSKSEGLFGGLVELAVTKD